MKIQEKLVMLRNDSDDKLKEQSSIKAYVAYTSDESSIIHYSAFPEGVGPHRRLPQRRETVHVPNPDTEKMILGQRPKTPPSSIFATGLNSCSAFIYVYMTDQNDIDHIVLYHSPSTVITKGHDPLAKKYNTQNVDPANIKVIIGTPNKVGDEGVKRALQQIIEECKIPEKNIFVYYESGNNFGIDSYGNIGGMGGNVQNYAFNILKKCFIETMQESMHSCPLNEPKKHMWQKTEKQRAEKFIAKINDLNSLSFQDFIKYLEKYFTSGNSQHPLKGIFLKNLIQKFSPVASMIGYDLSPSRPIDINHFLIALSKQIDMEANINLESLKSGATTSAKKEISNENRNI